jgi:hypothetical protein
MPFDITPFLTPNPGPVRYTPAASVPNAMELPRLLEEKRRNDLIAQEQQRATEAANARAAAQRELDWNKVQFAEQSKQNQQTEEILKKFNEAIIDNREQEANIWAAQLRARGVNVYRVGPEGPSTSASAAPGGKTPAGGTGTTSPAASGPTAEPSTAPADEAQEPFYMGPPTPGVRPEPGRRQWLKRDEGRAATAKPLPTEQELQEEIARPRRIEAFNQWLADSNAAGKELPPPEPILPLGPLTPKARGQQFAADLAKKGAERLRYYQTQAEKRKPAAPAPGAQPGIPGSAPGVVSQQPREAGWVARLPNGRTMKIRDKDVSTFRGRAIAEHFAPRAAEAIKPYEKKAAAEGLRVALAAEAAGNPLDKCLEAGQKAYEFEINKGIQLENAQTMARARAQSLQHSERIDPYQVQKDAVARFSSNYKVSYLQDLKTQTGMLLNALDETAFESGTVNNQALMTSIKSYQKGVTTDRDYANAAQATGLTGAIESLMQWLTGKGRIGKTVMMQIRGQLARALKKQIETLKLAAQSAYDWVVGVPELDPDAARIHGEAAAKAIYSYWNPPKRNQSAAAAPSSDIPKTTTRTTRGSSATSSLMVK